MITTSATIERVFPDIFYEDPRAGRGRYAARPYDKLSVIHVQASPWEQAGYVR